MTGSDGSQNGRSDFHERGGFNAFTIEEHRNLFDDVNCMADLNLSARSWPKFRRSDKLRASDFRFHWRIALGQGRVANYLKECSGWRLASQGRSGWGTAAVVVWRSAPMIMPTSPAQKT